MALEAGRGCPTAERLAEYAEGVLAPADRAAVERHLVDCSDCRAVIGESMAFLQAHPIAASPTPAGVAPVRSRRWVTGVVAGLAAAAALLIAVRIARPEWLEGIFGPRSDRPELQDLIAALANEPTRPVEGRLTGGFKYAPPPTPTRGPEDREVSPDVRIAAATIEKRAREEDTAANQASLGLAYLAVGDIEKSVAALEDAVVRQPDSAAFESDLSVAYMARATRRSRAEDWPKALAAAERALKLNPLLIEALYNRALALEHLHLSDSARDAWEQYRRHDPNSEWTRESDERVKPQSRSSAEEWDALRQQLDQSDVEDATVARIASDLPEQLETHLEDVLLPRAAAAIVDGNASRDSHVVLCRRVAAALMLRTQDRFPVDLAAAVITPSIAEGYRLWRRARELYESDRVIEAGATFRSAGAALPSDHPLIGWIRFYEGVVAYYRRDFDTAAVSFRVVRTNAARRQHSILLARAEWMLGLVAGVRGDFVEAAQGYERAVSIFRAAGCVQQLAKALDLLADVHAYLGDDHTLWRHRIAALALYGTLQNRRWRQALLSSASSRLVRQGHPEAALHFQHTAVRLAMSSGEPVAITEALLYRCRVLRRLNRLAEAVADLESAMRWRQKVADGVLGQSLDLDLAAETAALQPATGDDSLRRAIEFAERNQLNARLPHLLIGRAQMLRSAGDSAGAESVLRSALDVAQALAFKTSDGHDVTQLDEFSNTVRDLVSWQVGGGRAADAFETVESSRAPFLRRAVGAQLVPVSSLPARLPRGIVMLYYQPIHGGVATWRIDSNGIVPSRLPIVPAILERQIAEYRRALLTDPDSARRRDLSRTLYDELLAPVLKDVPAGATLALVLDGGLSRLSFSGLQASNGRYVVQDYATVSAPSASVFLALHARARRDRVAPATLLAVAGDRSSELGPVPDATREVQEIAALYESRATLTGSDITPAQFTRKAPGYSVVHFAGHALPNAEFPDLSRLVFPSVGGRPGLIFARDVSALRLEKFPVVVLSACETHVGRTSFSEGALSLARSFVAAGATQVVASLWKVDDAATRVLMTSFHRFLRSQGDASHALKMAQASAHAAGMPVHHWSAFTVIGAARTVGDNEQEAP